MPKSAKPFKTILRPGQTSLKWTVADVPRAITDPWKSGRLRVRGEINGFAFRTSLFPTGKGDFMLLVNKRMQAGAKVALGGLATVSLELDTEERMVPLPPELKKALAGSPAVRRYFEKQPYSVRKYIADLIANPKSPAARERQAERMAEVLFAMIDGEREAPPILQAAFARNPLAGKGWQRMTEAQRRGHLWSIFYYLSPESRQKRAGKAVAECIRIASGKGRQVVKQDDEEL